MRCSVINVLHLNLQPPLDGAVPALILRGVAVDPNRGRNFWSWDAFGALLFSRKTQERCEGGGAMFHA